MPLPQTSTHNALQIRRQYEAGVLSRPQAIAAFVALGFAPAAAAAAFHDPERARAAALVGSIGEFPQLRAASPEPRFPTNARVDVAETLAQRVDDLAHTVQSRILRYASKRNLLVYDGSVFDQLVHTFVSAVLPPERFEVLCQLRPCMDTNLQNEVRSFAARHNYELIEYIGDCEVDFTTLSISDPRCSNITPRISAFFEAEGGICFVGSASRDDHLLEMKAITEFYGRSTLIHDEVNGDVVWQTVATRGHSWSTVLLLHGMMPYEIVACAMAFAGQSPKPWHVPECYLPCYFEVEKMRARAVIERCSEALERALSDAGEEWNHNWARPRPGAAK